MQAWDEVLSSAPIPYRAIQLYYGAELCPIWRGGQPSWGYICWDGGNHAGKKILCAQWLASARMPLSSKVDYTADNPNFAMPSEDLFSFQHRNRRIPKEFCWRTRSKVADRRCSSAWSARTLAPWSPSGLYTIMWLEKSTSAKHVMPSAGWWAFQR